MPDFPIYDDRPELLCTGVNGSKLTYGANEAPTSFFIPRRYQLEQIRVFEKSVLRGEGGPKNFIVCWSRRSGKDIVHLYMLLMAALHRKGNYYYFLPTKEMSGRVILEGITNAGIKYIDMVINPAFIKSINHSTSTVYLINGSTVHLVGARYSLDSNLVGHNAMGIVLSEFSTLDHSEIVYNRLQPILQSNGGFLLINFTPRGRHHFSYELLMGAIDKAKEEGSRWYVNHKNSKELGIFTEEELEKYRVDNQISDEEFKSEYLCEFSGPGDMGQIFGEEVAELRESPRIRKLWVDQRDKTVFVAGDIGVHSATVLILFQVIDNGSKIYIFEVLSGKGESLKKYIDAIDLWCDENHGKRGTLYLPHDSKKERFGYSDVSSLYSDVIEAGHDVRVVRYEKKRKGIERCKKIFKSIYFNDTPTVLKLIRALNSYHYKYDEINRKLTTKTENDWRADFCDAFRYMCCACQMTKKVSKEDIALSRLYNRLYR